MLLLLLLQASVGVGEFLDLMKLVDFAELSGMRLIQVLPINDTSVYGMWWDSYPYSTVSVHALHPQYLALRGCFDSEADIPDDIARQVRLPMYCTKSCYCVAGRVALCL